MHWLHLFEEEFPRRSPRLQSTPSFGRKAVASEDYEPLTENDVTVLKKKRDVLAVCLAHLVVIWTVVPKKQNQQDQNNVDQRKKSLHVVETKP